MSYPDEQNADRAQLPLLPLRDVVVFPHMVIPLFVGRPKSIKALETAMEAGKSIVLVAQKSAAKDEPGPEDLYAVGSIANILQMLKLPDGTVKVLVEGSQRCRIDEIIDVKTHFAVIATPVLADATIDHEVEAMRRAVISQFDQYVKINKKIPPEILTSLGGIDEAGRLADTIAAHLPLKLEQKQEVLEMFEVKKRLEHLLKLVEGELDILQVEKRIRGRVKRQMEKSQREYYLNEQVKAIQKELGELEEGADLDEVEKRIKAAHMPKEARRKAEAELKKLRLMSPMSAEATVVRNYIDALVSLPWKKRCRISTDLMAAEKILNEDHYGLEKVKERIIEYLAVQLRVDKLKAPILCLVGAPGVGKTSLGQSIARATNRKFARATNRKFVRMSLGGVRDEAEIRGHRRTYIGSMPGKILQNMTKIGVRNPLFLLDEVDKMGMDFRGDPASALLEVLDPEQNHTFVDHYIEVEYDLSDVMFVCTANTLNIPPALLDRMETIRLSGYTEDEKVNIALRHLLPKLMRNHGLKPGEIVISESAIRDIIRYYTREAGVRALERELSKICRKVVKELVREGESRKVMVSARNLNKYLGVRRYTFGMAEKRNQIGQVNGLAWTEVGGELLTIEAAVMPGKGKMTTTGKLGEVMQESVQAALSVVRSRSKRLGIPEDFYQKNDIHIHLPEGATPKDGPSAGIGIATAMVAVLTGIPVRAEVAMTGEITLRGEALPIGGLKEKLLAALR
ncbi:MAG: endopeptidase La, partial [Betaproteobacteria bacterium]|nr:endopeptidase La [Betaproteobacteria bacterium]